MEIYNYYINTSNKDRDDTNFNFNYRLPNNFHINENQKAHFKLISFSMMNSMLNISETHKNNKFKVNFDNEDFIITIADGNYSVLTLRDTINTILGNEPYLLPLALNYEKTTNKYYWIMNDSCSFYPMNMKLILGFNNESYSLTTGTNRYGETFVNLLPYTKILITTNNLVFNPSTDNNLVRDYSSNEGINEIIAYIDKDEPPFTTLKYENLIDNKFLIANKNFSYVNFNIMNEYKEAIRDCPNCFIHFQIIIS